MTTGAGPASRPGAPGDPFQIQGCGTVTCSSRSQLAPDSSRPAARVILAGVHADAELCCLGHEQLARLHPQLAKVAANSPGPAAAPAAGSPELTPRQGHIGCCLRG